MDVTPLIPKGHQVIQSYGDGGFRITGTRYEGSVLVFPTVTMAWPITAPEEMTVDSLAAVFAASPSVEILLIGTGARMLLAPAALRRHFRDVTMAVDVMDTGAACRTYNVLLAEGRRVAAALIAVG